jgi:hypothetical protein
MDLDEIAFQERGASATGTTLIVVCCSWHKTKCHICLTCCSESWGSYLEKDWQQQRSNPTAVESTTTPAL